MARREGWECRKKRGVQGKAVEYLLDSLPEEIQSQLILSDQSIDYVPQRPDPFQIWKAVYYQLTEDESSKIVTYILREGLSALLIQIETNVAPRDHFEEPTEGNEDNCTKTK
ncbi:Mu DNA-binding domain [Moellerella wisconsensis]|nr:Mu DNA-binding domain [Moellerella wisconsensis]